MATNLSLLVGSILVAALAAELMIRLVAPQQLISIRPDVWQPADSVGYLFRPNLRTTINTGEREVHLLTNAEVIRRFISAEIQIEGAQGEPGLVRVRGSDRRIPGKAVDA